MIFDGKMFIKILTSSQPDDGDPAETRTCGLTFGRNDFVLTRPRRIPIVNTQNIRTTTFLSTFLSQPLSTEKGHYDMNAREFSRACTNTLTFLSRYDLSRIHKDKAYVMHNSS